VSDLPHILVVDDSNVVRTVLNQHLKDVYEIREEVDGESAWQALVLDTSIAAVISDLQMPVLDGLGLLERIRSCRLSRLRDIPFILISSEEDQAMLEKFKALGVSDVISKNIKASDLKTRLHGLLQFSLTQQSLEQSLASQTKDAKTGLFTRRYIELHAAQSISYSLRHDTPFCLMIIGFDNYARIISQLGEEKVESIGTKFAQKIADKIRKEDSVGLFSPGRFAVVSPGTAPEACAIFARRLRHAIAEANISAKGQRIPLTMSAGIASVPSDDASSAEQLMELAYQRMEAAIAAGGNRTEYGKIIKANRRAASAMRVDQALELIRAQQFKTVIPQLPALGKQILPLLHLMQKEFELEFPLEELEKNLAARKSRPSAKG
jgi:diguanylate cyclase (GGDEF)-like protein